MPENIVAILPELGVAIGQTCLMLAIGLSAALLIGGPLGILLFLLGPGQSLANRPMFLVLNWLVNTVRSFPFIILLVALVPFTRIVAGTSIGRRSPTWRGWSTSACARCRAASSRPRTPWARASCRSSGAC
jgi:D-methionine transport system permease protein